MCFFSDSSIESFSPTKRFDDGRAFSVSLMRVCFWRSKSSRICVRCLASASWRRPSALLSDMASRVFCAARTRGEVEEAELQILDHFLVASERSEPLGVLLSPWSTSLELCCPTTNLQRFLPHIWLYLAHEIY